MIRVLIADDHAIVRRGLRQIVSETHDIVVADEVGDGTEVLEKLRVGEYDAVILDISMPDGGVDLIKELKKKRPRLPILVLSVHPERQYALRALRAGAAGYLNKESAPDELIAAIRRVASGRRYVSPQLAEELASHLSAGADLPPHERLSDREYQVFCLIASGKRGVEIATELGLSAKTVSTYRGRILEKMGMKSNAELTHYAIKHGLVE